MPCPNQMTPSNITIILILQVKLELSKIRKAKPNGEASPGGEPLVHRETAPRSFFSQAETLHSAVKLFRGEKREGKKGKRNKLQRTMARRSITFHFAMALRSKLLSVLDPALCVCPFDEEFPLSIAVTSSPINSPGNDAPSLLEFAWNSSGSSAFDVCVNVPNSAPASKGVWTCLETSQPWPATSFIRRFNFSLAAGS